MSWTVTGSFQDHYAIIIIAVCQLIHFDKLSPLNFCSATQEMSANWLQAAWGQAAATDQ